MQRGLSALICARDEIASRRLSQQLSKIGVQSEWTRTAQDAIRQLAVKRYDVFTVDLILPDQDGVSLIRWLRDYGCQIPIIGLSLRNSSRPATTKLHAAVKLARTDDAANLARTIFAVKLATQRMEGYRPQILSLCSDEYSSQLITNTLAGYSQLVCASTIDEAIAFIRQSNFDLALVEPTLLADKGGLETLAGANTGLPLILNTISDTQHNTGKGSNHLAQLANIIRTYAMFGFQNDLQAQA